KTPTTTIASSMNTPVQWCFFMCSSALESSLLEEPNRRQQRSSEDDFEPVFPAAFQYWIAHRPYAHSAGYAHVAPFPRGSFSVSVFQLFPRSFALKNAKPKKDPNTVFGSQDLTPDPYSGFGYVHCFTALQ
ncbi:MAG: hypothetical protein WCE51_12020, partial [Chthoniobacterales bacterium]